MLRKLRNIRIPIAAIVILSGCKITQHYETPTNVTPDSLFRNLASHDTTTIATLPWEQIFTDPLLQALIREGISKNLDLKVAQARIHRAEANFLQSKAAQLPSLNIAGSGTLQQLSPSQGGALLPSQSYQFSLVSAWELDIWGKMRSNRRAALAALLQSDAFKRSVQTQLVSDIAGNYYTLLALDEQLKITQQTVQNRTKDVETVKILKESDVVTGAAVVQSEANRYSAEVTIPDLKQQIRETENTISVLLGRNPDSVFRSSLDEQHIAVDLKTGLPMQLLANRPDVQQAEYQLRTNFELVNVARTYFYPTVTITAQGGLANGNIFQFLDASSLFGNIIGGLTQPIFNQGINKQRLEVAKAGQEEALAVFKQSLLSAGQEVSNALYNYQAAVEKKAYRSKQIAYLEKSVDFTKELLKYSSSTSFIDVLLSEQSLLAAELNGVSDKLQQLQAVVTLYRSLGGGWR
jgi:NodT family efflux transporter outer membrane factor (OMF) lipoprotein